jgi:hypothetical protein
VLPFHKVNQLTIYLTNSVANHIHNKQTQDTNDVGLFEHLTIIQPKTIFRGQKGFQFTDTARCSWKDVTG